MNRGPVAEVLENLNLKDQKSMYGYLLYCFCMDLRSVKYSVKGHSHITYDVYEAADDFHNLPLFLAQDLKGFSHKAFWRDIDSKTFEYFSKKITEIINTK